MTKMIDYAIRYAKKGMAVFPLLPNDKEPINGYKDATTDLKIIEQWWLNSPSANIGIATGAASNNLIVIDVDRNNEKGIDGLKNLAEWQVANGVLPIDTMSVNTGSGGLHLYYYADREIKSRESLIPGVNLKGTGGYVVAPPSVFPDGAAYQLAKNSEGLDTIAANETVYKLIEAKPSQDKKKAPLSVPGVIVDGRHEMIFKLAASMQATGFSDAAILEAVKKENEVKCSPTLSLSELESAIKSAMKYQKGTKPMKSVPTLQQTEAAGKAPDWIYTLRRNDKGLVINSIDNVCTILRNDENLKGRIKYNSFSYAPWIIGQLPWDKRENNREWANLDDSNLKCYIEASYAISNGEKILEALAIVSNENKFNPVCDRLNSLEWDGTKRIERLLSDYLGVENTEYTQECMKIFMLGAINRAFSPACKFDYMLVLTGTQGVGKSTFFRRLSLNDEWFNDNFNTVEGDKAAEKLRGMWIVELAELLAVKRAKEVESMKAFITSTVDMYRAPYARRTESRPRQCVFAGTTNSDHFLTDKTGNRRYLPLKVNKAEVKKSLFADEAKEEFIQAWAEAMAIYRSGEYSLVLPQHLQEQAQKKQEIYVEEDTRVGMIQEWLNNTKEKLVCVAMIYEHALGNDLNKPDRKTSNEIHDIMAHCIKGWVKCENENGGRRRCGGYGVQVCYEPVQTEEEKKFTEADQEVIPFK